MLLFASDFHFGRFAPAEERETARAFDRLLDAHADAERLLLVGDLFEAWVEHRTLVPRVPLRFGGALARWVDAGRGLVVFAGNHDPWHRSYLRDELGADVVLDGWTGAHAGRRLFVHHGDGLADHGRERQLRRWLRHPVPVGLYRTVLPGDLGQRLALAASRRMRGDDDPAVAADGARALRAEALRRLANGPFDAVVVGHSHAPEVAEVPGGTYANPGAFFRQRQAVVLGNDGAFRLVTAPGA